MAKPGRPNTAPFVQYCCQKRDVVIRASVQFPPRAPAIPRTLSTRRPDAIDADSRRARRGAHPFSSFEKTLQGREAVEENLYIRDKEAAAKYKREAELQAERLADASKAFKKEFSQELATMLHQKHLAERQKALRKHPRQVNEHEGRDTHSDLVNVKAGITTTAEKAAREAFAAAYGTEHEGKDTHSDLVNVKAGITTTKEKAAREALFAPSVPSSPGVASSPALRASPVVLHSAAAYGTEWEGEDTRSDLVNVKAGITTTAAKAAREGFEGAYSDAHAGEDTRSNIVRAKGGFTTTEAAAAREGFEGAYGSEWEGRDSLDNLQVGSMIPDAGAGRGIGFEGAYGKEWEGRDSLDNLQTGSLVPDKGASRREGYEGAYGTEWEGRDAKDNIATGSLLPDAGAGQREGFAAAYGEAHEGWDARESG